MSLGKIKVDPKIDGGKWYQTGRDYPDIKLEADAVPDNYQTDATNPPPGRGGPAGFVQGLISM